MFGLDERIAASSDGASIWIVLVVAVLLGLRHATDPDHLTAVTTLVAPVTVSAIIRPKRISAMRSLGSSTRSGSFIDHPWWKHLSRTCIPAEEEEAF